MAYKLAIVDMDGTMIESEPYHARVWDEFMITVWRRVTPEEFDSFVGITVTECFDRIGIPKERHREFFKSLGEYYLNEGREYLDMVKLQPYVRESLEELKKRGVKLAICSNSLNEVVRMFMDYHDLSKYFDIMIGSDFESYTKIERCTDIQNMFNAKGPEVLYIGDSDGDMKLAHDMNYDAVLADTELRWCNDKEYAIKTYHPKYIIKSFKEFYDRLMAGEFD